METKSSRPSAASDTNLWHKYRTDLFFRTTCHIIVLQIVLTAVVIGIFWFAMQYLARDISQGVINGIMGMLDGQSLTTERLLTLLETTTTDQFLPVAIAVFAVVLCFGFIMAYIALTPARRSLERQKRFISNIAHELRTPLAIVRTNTDVTLLNKNLPDHLRGTLSDNISELDRVSEIINNLLSLSNLMRNGHQTQFTAVDLSAVSQRAIDTLAATGIKKEITTTIQENTHQLVLGNETALEQVAFNLIKNALSHTESGGTITVTTEPASSKYINLIVSDNGAGISRSDLFHIFEPFYRVRDTKNSSGGGLGLTIVNEIVQMHRGKITIRSTRDRGTTVIVSIPKYTPDDTSTKDETEGNTDNATGEVSMDFSRSFLQ